MHIGGTNEDDDQDNDDIDLGGRNKIPRVKYSKDDKNDDYANLDIYKQFLDDDEQNTDDDEVDLYCSEQKQPKLDHIDTDDDEEDPEKENEWEDLNDGSIDDDDENPLDKDIFADTKKEKAKTVADVWFEQDIFKDAMNEDDEDFEIEKKIQSLKSHGKTILGRNKKILTNGSADVDKDEDEIQLPLKGILKTSTSKITKWKKRR